MSFLAIFEEESLFPKATDETFRSKLFDNMLGKHPNFAKPNPRPDPDAHFAIGPYAATVSYNLTGWLEKNKDPLNDTIVEMIKNGSNSLAIACFADHPGQPLEAPKDQDRKKKGGGKTVSSFFKGQLDDLMTTLYKTEPHFIRCVVPNTHKIPGGVEPGLVMHQYQCNGVLAGIAICRAGFPNKMLYPEFKARYNILAAQAVAKAKNDKAAAGAVMDVVKLDKEKFRLGHTKVFFRAGILGWMEEVREDRIGSVLAWLQSGARGKASRMQFKKLQDQKLALYCCQRAIRNMMMAKTWKWMQIWMAIKPTLKCTQFGKYKKEYEDKIAIAEANIDKAIAGKIFCCFRLKMKILPFFSSQSATLSSRCTPSSLLRRMSWFLLFSPEDPLSRRSLTRPLVWRTPGMICRSRWTRPTPASRERTTPSLASSRLDRR